ncbi:hypothetical protein [Tropicimonas sediminicola]|uniref:Tetratricopeptide repeat-containing protein n=1 Tax=Tropicimonas sediminicola TaxID=1031541 RepID=A0A239I0K6_9RHOB|nr:hypothetical protein [Tropicimonas sediminicola]SNS86573.1 hypothetical protein SAMN05421757_104107 [Tropicimonas sediminicola]
MPASQSLTLAPVASFAVLVFAAWQGVSTLGDTPAFNRELRVEAPYGGTRPILTATMYDTAGYLYQMGYGEAHFIANALMQGADLSTITVDTMREHTARAASLTEASLAVNPASAHAWQLLAESLRGTRQPEPALEAFRRSYELAPYSSSLASRRLRFAAGQGEDVVSDPQIRVGIERDVETILMFRPQQIDPAREAFPEIVAAVEARIPSAE